MNCGYCGEKQKQGEWTYRKSSVDCMESPSLRSLLDIIAKPPRHRLYSAATGIPARTRKVQYSVNNPNICQDCQKSLNSFARACCEIEKEKAS